MAIVQQKGLQLLHSPSKEEKEEAEGGFCESYPSNCNALCVLSGQQHNGLSPVR